MIIDDVNKFIFIHNPKCAGTSIRLAISHLDSYNNYFAGYDVIEGKKIGKMHIPLSLLYILYPKEFAKLESYFSFVVVRNPLTRFLSGFNIKFYEIFYEYSETKDVRKYSDFFNNFVASFDQEYILKYNYEYRHFIKQKDFIYFEDDNIIDRVYKFETLQNDIQELEWMMPVIHQKTRNLKFLNVRKLHHPLSEIMTLDSKKKIEYIYREDFDVFNYVTDI